MLEDEGADADGFIAEHADVADPDGVDVDGVSFNDPVASEAGGCEHADSVVPAGVDGHGATGTCSCACTCAGAGGNEYIDHGRDGLSGGPAAQPMLIGT